MAQTIDFENDEFMTLLTDALRAGPGSPEWHQAVGKLRALGVSNSDEYQLLISAREDLESGREFRSVRAGAGFSRKVMSAIEEEGAAGKGGLPSANIIAFVAGMVILSVVVVVAVLLFKSAREQPKPTGNGLRATIFNTRVAALNLDGATDVAPEFKLVGEIPLKITRDGLLKPATTQPAANDKREYRRGAIVRSESAAPDQTLLVEVALKINKAGEGLIPQVFVCEGAVNEKEGSSQNELVWLLNKNGMAQAALPNGRVVPTQGEKVGTGKWPQTVNIKIIINKDTVIVDCADRKIYEGPHELSADKPRYVGVRFLRKTGDNSDNASLAGFKVFKP